MRRPADRTSTSCRQFRVSAPALLAVLALGLTGLFVELGAQPGAAAPPGGTTIFRDVRVFDGAGTAPADPARTFVVIMKDGRIYTNTLPR